MTDSRKPKVGPEDHEERELARVYDDLYAQGVPEGMTASEALEHNARMEHLLGLRTGQRI